MQCVIHNFIFDGTKINGFVLKVREVHINSSFVLNLFNNVHNFFCFEVMKLFFYIYVTRRNTQFKSNSKSF